MFSHDVEPRERRGSSGSQRAFGAGTQGGVMNGDAHTHLWRLKKRRRHRSAVHATSSDCISKDEMKMIRLHLPRLVSKGSCCGVFNWSVHNVMNFYKAVSQSEPLSAFPARRSASHLPHISIISKYIADILGLDSKSAGTPRHTKSHRMQMQNNTEAPVMRGWV